MLYIYDIKQYIYIDVKSRFAAQEWTRGVAFIEELTELGLLEPWSARRN